MHHKKIKIDIKKQQEHFDDDNRQYKWVKGVESTLAQRYEYKTILEKLPKKKGLKVVDYGCGTGRVSLILLSKGINVVAVDISQESLKKLEKINKRYRSKKWGKLTTVPEIPDEKYDAIVGADVLHHVPIDETLDFFKKHLKPGGRIIFSEPNAVHLPWYLYYFLHKIPFSIEKGILQCTYLNLKTRLKKQDYSNIEFTKHGLISTPFLNRFPRLMRLNINLLSKIPILNLFCFRFIISADV